LNRLNIFSKGRGLLNLEKKVSLYIVVLLLFVGIIGSVLFAASVRSILLGGDKLGDFEEIILEISKFPSYAKQVLNIKVHTQKIKNNRFEN